VHSLLRFLGEVRDALGPGEETDPQLLSRFVCERDQAAFAALLRRHGAVVLSVCRRILGNLADADDAFQATFLVLLRKAGSLRRPGSLGPWLYGVAYRTALKARGQAARRRSRQEPLTDLPAPESTSDLLREEARRLLDEEVQRLPERYRVALVLCELEGRTHEEAGRLLGCPRETVSTRVARARQRLRNQLVRRGLALSVPGVAVLLGEGAQAAVPGPLAEATRHAARALVAGKATAGTIPAHVLTLATEVVRIMALQKVKAASVLLLAAGVLAGGALSAYWGARAEAPAAPAAEAPREDADGIQGLWTVVADTDPDGDVKAIRPGDPTHFTVEFKGRKMTARSKKRTIEATYTLDPHKSPRHIDAVRPGKGGKELLFRGIYGLERDRLRVCLAGPGKERPREFKGGVDVEFAVELKRVMR
jgi:RNA polymerase sigma factor (sigma-70 family)